MLTKLACLVWLITTIVAQPGPGARRDRDRDADKEKKPEPVLRTAADRPVDIRHIRLDLNVDIPKKTAAGKAVIDLTPLRDVKSIRFDAVDFDVKSVSLARGEAGPSKVDFANHGDSIEIFVGDSPLTTGTRAAVTIEYAVTDPKSGLHFFGPTESDPDTPYVVWSQGESIDNRHWVPCFDHPNEMQTTEMVVTAAKGNQVISNGRLVNRTDNPNGTVTFHWLQDQPHVAYLMSLIVGEFHMEQDTWRGKPVQYYVPPKNKDDIRRSFDKTPKMLEHFSNVTGVEYPWPKYAQTCVAEFGGGMENTSATTLGTGTLHDERAHLDISSEGLVSHELGHQWFGDYVTCKDWSHLWLNEGWASYMEPVWYEFDRGKDEYDQTVFQDMESAIRGGKERPVVDPLYQHPDDMFDSRSYPKGASILHMLRRRVGDDMFWRCVKRYLTENAHQPVETSDFRKAFERETGRSLERFFHDWTARPGHPVLDVRYEWNEDEKLAEVSVKQTQDAEAFHFPLEIECSFDDAKPTTLLREMTEKEQRFLFPLPKRPNMVIVDPRDAVLKEIKENKGRDLWVAQLTRAPYVTARIRAARHFGEAKSDQDLELLGKALREEKFWGVGSEIAKALGTAGGDKARGILIEGLTVEHPKVRRAVAEQLGSFHREPQVLSSLYGLIQKGDPSYLVEAEAIESYGKLQPDDALPFLTSLLRRDSHQERIRAAALEAIGRQKTTAGLATLFDWSQPGKPRNCRTTAISAMAALAQAVELSDTDQSRIVDTLVAHLSHENARVKRTAIDALRNLGTASRPALPALRALAASESSERVRKAAEDAADKIASGEPAQVQVAELRDQLDKLREENRTLRDRLDKLEARGHDAPVEGSR